jgi:putative nucleotidyltransferase with HDIG domain
MVPNPTQAFLPFEYDPFEMLPPLLDAHHPGLGGHCLRTALAAGLLARRLGFSALDCLALRLGALYHDAGKLFVPSSLLAAPRGLTVEELELVRRHVASGLRLLRHTALPLVASDAIAHHHERWDGKGYPLGLNGHRIPLAGRLLAVIDVYDTIRSPRPYGPVLSREEALELLDRVAGSQLDPDLVPLAARLPEEVTWSGGFAIDALGGAGPTSQGWAEAARWWGLNLQQGIPLVSSPL